MDELGLFCALIALFVAMVALVAAGGAWVFVAERLLAVSVELRRVRQRLEVVELEGLPAAESAPAPPVPEPEAPIVEEPVAEQPTFEPTEVDGPGTEPAAKPTTPARKPLQLPSPERIAVFLAAGVGGLALVVGVLFALVAVLQTGLLGPAVRVCLGLVGGTVLWVVGAVLRSRVRLVGSALEGAAMGSLFGALFAAHGFYRLLGPLQTFALLATIAGVAALRAAVHRDRFMAWLGLVGGLLAPVLVSTGNNGAVGLFSYLFLLLSGTVGIAAWRRWPDLVLGSSLGAAGLYAGWTGAWYAVDSVWIALLSAFALQVPFAAGAALVGQREGETATLRRVLVFTLVAGSAVFPVLALPWVFSLDAVFVDPRTGLSVVQSGGPVRMLGAAALLALPVPLWMAGRMRRQVAISALSSVLAGALTLVWAVSWSVQQGADAVIVTAVVAPLAVGLFLHVGARRTGAALLLSLPAIAVVLVIVPGLGITGMAHALAVAAVVVLCAGGAYIASSGALSAGAVVALCLPLLIGAAMAPDLGSTWVLGAALVALGGLSGPALVRRWNTDRLPTLPWLGALLAGPAVFPALYVLWEAELGVGAIGVLPALLGAHGVLTAAVLVRGYGVRRDSPLLALAVAIAMLGITFALPVQFQERWLTVGWALEGLALAVLALWARHPLLRWGSVGLGITIGVRLLVNPYALAYGDTSGWPILNWTLYTWGIPTLALVASGWLVRRTAPSDRDWLVWAPMTLWVLSMLTGFALVNVEVSHAFQNAGPVELGGATMLQGMVRSLAWAGWGLFLLVTGLAVRSRLTRFIGFAFLMLAAAKVFVYDIWSLPGFVRVGSFVGLGVLLIISAILFDRVVIRGPEAKPATGA